jgi:hypothetical protein
MKLTTNKRPQDVSIISLLNMLNNEFIKKLIGYDFSTDTSIDTYLWISRERINNMEWYLENRIEFKEITINGEVKCAEYQSIEAKHDNS